MQKHFKRIHANLTTSMKATVLSCSNLNFFSSFYGVAKSRPQKKGSKVIWQDHNKEETKLNVELVRKTRLLHLLTLSDARWNSETLLCPGPTAASHVEQERTDRFATRSLFAQMFSKSCQRLVERNTLGEFQVSSVHVSIIKCPRVHQMTNSGQWKFQY